MDAYPPYSLTRQCIYLCAIVCVFIYVYILIQLLTYFTHSHIHSRHPVESIKNGIDRAIDNTP